MYHHQFIIKNSIKAPPFIMISMYVFRNQVNDPNSADLISFSVGSSLTIAFVLICFARSAEDWQLFFVIIIISLYYIYYIIIFISFLSVFFPFFCLRFYFLLDFTQKQTNIYSLNLKTIRTCFENKLFMTVKQKGKC